MKAFLITLLVLFTAASLRAAGAGVFELRAVADQAGADTREFDQRKAEGAGSEKVPLEPEVLLDSSALQSAVVEHVAGSGEPRILIVLTEAGGKRCGEITTKYLHRRLGIVLGGELVASPNVMEPILGGTLAINGNFTEAQAADLVGRLNASIPKPTP